MLPAFILTSLHDFTWQCVTLLQMVIMVFVSVLIYYLSFPDKEKGTENSLQKVPGSPQKNHLKQFIYSHQRYSLTAMSQLKSQGSPRPCKKDGK